MKFHKIKSYMSYSIIIFNFFIFLRSSLRLKVQISMEMEM